MTTMRLTQNFAGLHATVISAAEVSILLAVLQRIGVKSTHLTGEAGSAAPIVPLLRPEVDILIVDCDSDAATELAVDPAALAAIPVIGLISGESPSRLKRVFRIGAMSVIRRPIHGGTIFPALFMGINCHRQRLEREAELADVERRRRARRFIMKATLHLMQTQGLSDDAAFDSLRRLAMQARQSVEDYCESIVGEQIAFTFPPAIHPAPPREAAT